jgi:hypothetical protein
LTTAPVASIPAGASSTTAPVEGPKPASTPPITAWLAGGRHSAVGGWQVLSRLADSLTRRVDGHRVVRPGPAWAYVAAIISWIVLWLRQVPCRYSDASSNPDRFGWMCYSDITALYFTRGQSTGAVPYIGASWEYPVLTGYFAGIANWLGRLFGAHTDPGVSGQQMVDNMNIYFAVTAVALFACLIWLIHSTLRIIPDHPLVAVFVAAAPAMWSSALINWDLLAVALAAAGLAAWQEQRFVRSGIWLGLGVAAKLYPIVIIGALIVLALRPEALRDLKKLKQWATMALAAAISWILVNLPVMVTQWDGWAMFYTFNSDRGADFGSFWYSLVLAGTGPAHPIMWSRVIMILCFLGLAVVIWIAPKSPSAIQIAYLAVAIMTACNLVYSPQYVLWLLPLIAVVRRKALDLSIFSLSELVYYVFIWLYLRGEDLSLGLSDAPWLYIWSIWLRLIATAWVMARVVRDILRGRVEPPPTEASPARRAEPDAVAFLPQARHAQPAHTVAAPSRSWEMTRPASTPASSEPDTGATRDL